MEEFCTMLKCLEEKSGLKEVDYCKKLGMPRSTYRDWKYGQVPLTLRYLFKIAMFHRISLDSLFQPKKFEGEL